jgi:hypothetical protein
MVKARVDRWPLDDATGIEIDELIWGEWVTVLSDPPPSIGTYPDYTTVYEINPASSEPQLRARWVRGTEHSVYLEPGIIRVPNAQQEARFAEAVLQKAIRFLKLPEAPFGHSGVTEWGVASVQTDRQIEELLYGLRFQDWDIWLPGLVTTDDVIRVGLQIDPARSTANPADVQRAINAAASWVAERCLLGVGVA